MRKLLKSKWFWAVAILTLPVAITVGYWYSGVARLNDELASLRAQGLPVTAAELNDFHSVPVGVPDTTELWVAGIAAVEAADVGKRGKDLPFVGENGSKTVPPPGEEWADLNSARALLGDLQAELSAVYTAADAGGQARYAVNFSAGFNTPLPHLQEARNVARVLKLDAHVAAHSGDSARTHRDCLAIFRLAESLANEPTLISQLVRMAIFAIGCETTLELMPHCGWSDDELDRLQATILSLNLRKSAQAAFQGERAMALTSLNTTVPAALRTPNAMETLRMFDTAIAALDGPWHEALQRNRKLNKQVAALGSGTLSRIKYMGVMLYAPAFEQAVTTTVRNESRRRCFAAALASERYRLEHGNWPASLSAIDARQLGNAAQTQLLTDPFTGEPLRYKLEDDRLLIYSTGPDRKDDGGDLEFDGPQFPPDYGISIRKLPRPSPVPADVPQN